MQTLFARINKQRFVSACGSISILLLASSWFWLWFILHKSSQTLILHFNDIQHINLVGDLRDIYGFAASTFVIAVFDLALAFRLDERDPWLGKLIAGLTLLWAALIFAGIAAIIRVN